MSASFVELVDNLGVIETYKQIMPLKYIGFENYSCFCNKQGLKLCWFQGSAMQLRPHAGGFRSPHDPNEDGPWHSGTWPRACHSGMSDSERGELDDDSLLSKTTTASAGKASLSEKQLCIYMNWNWYNRSLDDNFQSLLILKVFFAFD